MKYLTLIRAVCLLHQYQRPLRVIEHQGKRVQYIEVCEEDIAHADRLASEVLRRSMDELTAQTRRLLRLVEAMVLEAARRQGFEPRDVRFTRRDVREYTGWGNTQLKVHLGRLEEHEYVLLHRARHAQRFVYELAYSSREAGIEEYDENRAGVGRNEGGGESGPIRPPSESDEKAENAGSHVEPVGMGKSALKGVDANGASYPSVSSYVPVN